MADPIELKLDLAHSAELALSSDELNVARSAMHQIANLHEPNGDGYGSTTALDLVAPTLRDENGQVMAPMTARSSAQRVLNRIHDTYDNRIDNEHPKIDIGEDDSGNTVTTMTLWRGMDPSNIRIVVTVNWGDRQDLENRGPVATASYVDLIRQQRAQQAARRAGTRSVLSKLLNRKKAA